MSHFLKFDSKSALTSLETILFIREVIEVHPEHREVIFNRICDIFDEIRSHLVFRVALWILGEYSSKQADIERAFDVIKRNIGSLPLMTEEEEEEEESKPQETSGPKMITKTIILQDGSYGTETVIVDEKSRAQSKNQKEREDTYFRRALLGAEDDYISSCVAITLIKLVIKTKKNMSNKFNQMTVDSILIICQLLKLHQKKKNDPDSKQRMQLCLRILTNPTGMQ
jgi:coatomer subunit beta